MYIYIYICVYIYIYIYNNNNNIKMKRTKIVRRSKIANNSSKRRHLENFENKQLKLQLN